ncbi:hypothetical protein BKA61DRAFT_593024 [Leptodontidium sp. MPI-SDFR-AT-0119]|nr:hypothetical protein BKA61DRAFT_593024 [Leptodontidium sp. MPI-SDFR-AT-0119]
MPVDMGLWLPSSLSAALFAIALPSLLLSLSSPVSYQLLVILASLARIVHQARQSNPPHPWQSLHQLAFENHGVLRSCL